MVDDITTAPPINDAIPGTGAGTDVNPAENSKQPKRWRDVLPIHPAAELFPLMSEAELRELADDIEANGLLERVTVIEQDGVPYLLDGRNRLDALELLGRKIFVSKYDPAALYKSPKRMTWKKRKEARAADHDHSSPSIEIFEIGYTDDPLAFILSKNVHRRHLTADQRRELIAQVLRAKPQASNRKIAQQTKADHKTMQKAPFCGAFLLPGTLRRRAPVCAGCAPVSTRLTAVSW
jgi:ParB-like nuclease domain